MDWRVKVIIIAFLQLYMLRMRMIVMFACYYLARKRREQSRKRKRPCHYSVVDRIPEQITHIRGLVHLSDETCINNLRMDRNAFSRLCFLLENVGGLQNTRFVSVEVQTAMFLHVLAHHTKNRIIKDRFKRSGQTVSYYFKRTLVALMKIHELLMVKPKPIPDDSTDSRWKCFKGCLGALDGTYIRIKVPAADKTRYRSRKGIICTNVLGVCDTNMNFVYILSGWEGSAADGRVLRDAVCRPTGLRVPTGNYYLCDQGYTNCEGFLTPYRGKRYHLDEWSSGSRRPRDHEEYFNMKHSQARNIIERAFCLLKGRWAILRSNSFYSVEIQNQIIMACAMLHNYIRLHMSIDPFEHEPITLENEHEEGIEYIDVVEPSPQWTTWRDGLALQMFNSRRSA